MKIDMVYVAKGNFWSVLGQIVTALSSLALMMVFANYLPKEIYGLYRYILSLMGVLGIFSMTGMNQAVAQAVAAGNDGALRISVAYQLKWNVLQFIASSALSAYYFYNHQNVVALSLLIMGIGAPLTSAFNTYGAYLDGKRQFRLNNIFGIVSIVVYAVSMAAVIILSGEVVWLIAAYALSTFLTTFAFYLATLRAFRPPATGIRDVLKFGRELTFIGFIGPIAAQVDKIILAHFWGAAQLATYTLVTAIPDRANIAIKNLIGIGMPKFSTKTPQELNRVFYLRIFQGLAIGAVCTLGYVILAPYVFTYLLPKYLDALFYSQLLSIYFIFGLPNRYISLMMASQKLSRIIFISNTTQVIMKIILYIILGTWGGLLGLVIAQITIAGAGMLISMASWRLATRAT